MAKQFKSTDIVNTAKVLIYNKIVLYFVLAIALLNLFYSATHNDYVFCAIFILVGFIVAFFNKNMTVILVCTIAIANIVSLLISGNHRLEGMKENIESDDSAVAALNVENKGTPVEYGKPDEEEKISLAAVSEKTGSMDAATKKKMVNTLKTEAQDLLEVQQKIIKGFEKIEPEMTRAEKLINQINGTAKQIQAFQGMN